MVSKALPDILNGADREGYDERCENLKNAGVPKELAVKVAGMSAMVSLFDIVEVSGQTERDPELVMAVYFQIGARLDLNWLRDRIIELPRANRWQSLARMALRDELYGVHRALTQEVLDAGEEGDDADAAVQAWSRQHANALERTLATLADIRASRTYDTTTLPVGLREVRNLVRGRAASGAPGTRARA
jgi:glutamate dehydrogenase